MHLQKSESSREKVSTRLSLSNRYPHPVESTLEQLQQNGIDEDTRAHVLQILLSTFYKHDEKVTESELLNVTKEFLNTRWLPLLNQRKGIQSSYIF